MYFHYTGKERQCRKTQSTFIKVKVSTSWTTMTVESTMAVEDFYIVLKLNRSADAHEIRRNYQTLAKQVGSVLCCVWC